MCKAVDASGLAMLEVGSISAAFARAWKALGGKCWIGQWSTQPAWFKQAQDFSMLPDKVGTVDTLTWICASLSEDPAGAELRDVKKAIEMGKPEGILLHAPRGPNREKI